MELDPKHAEALYFLALAEQRSENRSEAALLWRRYLGLKPEDARGYYELGQMELALGSRAAAIDHWKKAVELDPDHRNALYNLFRELRAVDPEQALRYQERFQASESRQRIGDRADTLGNFALASLRSGDVAAAIEQLNEAIKICQGCRTEFLLHKNLGLIYARAGDLDQAEVELKRAAGIRSDDPEVVQSLATIAQIREGKQPAPR
jgi:tetratricopeptide (TPR) repeat protein